MSQGFSLKDQLFNAEKVAYLAGQFAASDAGFDAPAFERAVMARLGELELKERIDWICECLEDRLPAAFPEAAPRILAALPPALDPTKSDDDFGDFIFSPLGAYVAKNGIAHPDIALDTMEELTQRFSMEWAIRAFLKEHEALTVARLSGWVRHPSYHVRRLVSEGTRPKLPWAPALKLDTALTLPLLATLHADTTRFVTRSVANHLNDIAKTDPDCVLDALEAWSSAGAQTPREMAWITGHALRTLVKQGNPRAMEMLGYSVDADLKVEAFAATPDAVKIGDTVELTARISAPTKTKILVDTVFWFTKANGSQTPKVLKWSQTETGPAGKALTKRHRLKGDATTFRLYPGPVRVEMQVNGRICSETGFDLTE